MSRGKEQLEDHCDMLNAKPSAKAMGWYWFVGERQGRYEVMRKESRPDPHRDRP